MFAAIILGASLGAFGALAFHASVEWIAARRSGLPSASRALVTVNNGPCLLYWRLAGDCALMPQTRSLVRRLGWMILVLGLCGYGAYLMFQLANL